MLRLATPIFVLAAFAASAEAQHHGGGGHGGGFHSGGFHAGGFHPGSFHMGAALPLSPGVMPGSPIGPGTQFLPPPMPHFGGGHTTGFGSAGIRRVGLGIGYGGYGYGLGYGYGGYGYGLGYGYGGYGYGSPYYGYGYGYPYGYGYGYSQFNYALSTGSTPIRAAQYPAGLTIQTPTASRMWVNGEQVKGDEVSEHTLTSPLLVPGENYTFNIKLRWTTGGKTYETSRAVVVRPGDHSRLLIVSGDETKE